MRHLANGDCSHNPIYKFIIIIIINEYPEAGQGPLFLSKVDNIYTNINQN